MENYNEFLEYLGTKTKVPQITEFSYFPDKIISQQVIDVSVNSSSEEFVWGFASSKTNLSDDQKLKKLSSYKSYFVDNLLKENFENIEDSEIVEFAEHHLSANRIIFLTWITQLFWEYQKNEPFVVKLLDLLMCFSYDEVQPQASDLALACKVIKSPVIQSKNLSLLGHWCNQRALDIIANFEEPSDPWISIKYNHLREIIESRCSTSEK